MQGINCMGMVLRSWRFRNIHPIGETNVFVSQRDAVAGNRARQVTENLSSSFSHGVPYSLTYPEWYRGSGYVPAYLLSARNGMTPTHIRVYDSTSLQISSSRAYILSASQPPPFLSPFPFPSSESSFLQIHSIPIHSPSCNWSRTAWHSVCVCIYAHAHIRLVPLCSGFPAAHPTCRLVSTACFLKPVLTHGIFSPVQPSPPCLPEQISATFMSSWHEPKSHPINTAFSEFPGSTLSSVFL